MMSAVREGVDSGAASDKRTGHCSACFTGKYPVEFDKPGPGEKALSCNSW